MGSMYKRPHRNSEAFQNTISSCDLESLQNSEGKYCPRFNKSQLIKSIFTDRCHIGFKTFT